MPVVQLSRDLIFPATYKAQKDGLLAVGGDLSLERLKLAYQSGIFPWYGEDLPILWWTPDPRFVLFPNQLKVAKSLKQIIRNKGFEVTVNKAFNQVIRLCQKLPRKGQDGTWITQELREAYTKFYQAGWAHSVEVWQDGNLVGGLYGVAMGKVFFGESMFTQVSNASKVGFVWMVETLATKGFKMIDCQVYTKHLESLGAVSIPRVDFEQKLVDLIGQPPQKLNW